MSNKNLTIELHAREDKNKQIFYVGKLKCPAVIDCREGAVFLIYTSVEGEEQLQIANLEAKEQKDDNSSF